MNYLYSLLNALGASTGIVSSPAGEAGVEGERGRIGTGIGGRMINIGDYAWGNNGSFERILEELMVQVRSSLSLSLFYFLFRKEGRGTNEE